MCQVWDHVSFVHRRAARVGFNLPYVWSSMSIDHGPSSLTYTARRHLDLTGSRCVVISDPGAVSVDRDPLATFLTARFRLYGRGLLGLYAIPVEHQPWPLDRAAVGRADRRSAHLGGRSRGERATRPCLLIAGLRGACRVAETARSEGQRELDRARTSCRERVTTTGIIISGLVSAIARSPLCGRRRRASSTSAGRGGIDLRLRGRVRRGRERQRPLGFGLRGASEGRRRHRPRAERRARGRPRGVRRGPSR